MMASPIEFLRALSGSDVTTTERWVGVVWWYTLQSRSDECTSAQVGRDMLAAGYGKQHATRLTEALDKDRRLAKGSGRQRTYSIKITARAELDAKYRPFLEKSGEANECVANVTADEDGSTEPVSDKVFVVHGHDHGFKNTVARFLEVLGLKAIILHERPDGGRTVIEKFEQESGVSFAVVLATPDDLAESAAKLKASADGKLTHEQLEARARQNVVFELGYFIGKLGRARAALITQAGVRLPSDLAGIIYIDRGEWQKRLYDALSEVGYEFSQSQTRSALAIYG